MQTTNYRVDFTPDGEDRETVIPCGPNRRLTQEKARQISRRASVGTAYAIATRNGQDTGQRVYSGGAFSYQDDAF